jgi:hypothetical protein
MHIPSYLFLVNFKVVPIGRISALGDWNSQEVKVCTAMEFKPELTQQSLTHVFAPAFLATFAG